jgi:hypothetical protein
MYVCMYLSILKPHRPAPTSGIVAGLLLVCNSPAAESSNARPIARLRAKQGTEHSRTIKKKHH